MPTVHDAEWYAYRQIVERVTGRTWAELAAAHEMPCGACRGGILRLDDVHIWPFDSLVDSLLESPSADHLATHRATDVRLVCDGCGFELEMPLHEKEV
jgi:hypothetical protein